MLSLARIAVAAGVAAAAVFASAAPASARVCERVVDTTCAVGSSLCVAYVAGNCLVPYQTEVTS